MGANEADEQVPPMPRLLVACEYSGRVRDAFTAKGWDATSCDLVPSDTPGKHIIGDVTELLKREWDMVIAFPPCTHLSCVSSAHWAKWQADGTQDRAAEFFLQFTRLDHVPEVAIENPAGAMSTRYRKPDQYVQPWWFGDPWTKRTGLWLKGLPKLVSDQEVKPLGPWVGYQRLKDGTLSKDGSLLLGHGRKDGGRSKARSTTFEGLARAMAEQWG